MRYELEKITSLLPTGGNFSAGGMYYFPEIESTNSWLLQQPTTKGKCCLADHQTAGKGRRGKTWLDNGNSVLLSMGWNLPAGPVSGLSLVSGIAVVRTLQQFGLASATLKWPNDVLAHGSKLAGILVEISGSNVVVGVGINLELGDAESIRMAQPWIDLKSLDVVYDPNELVANLLINHDEIVTQCIEEGFSPFIEQWNAMHAWAGLSVTVESSSHTYSGVALGVGHQGELLIETNESIKSVSSAGVSVRPIGNVNASASQI